MDLLAQNSDKVIAILLLISTSLAFRIMLQRLGQKWIVTTAHTATLVLLPIITFVITGVIAGNIALSLGMVGALSIVRFRNPVRSPLELVVYFGAITMGIAAKVSILWFIFFVGAVTLAAIVLVITNKVYILLFNKPFFTASFSEGNSLSTFEVLANDTMPELESSAYLISQRYGENEISYMLAANSFTHLCDLQKRIKNSSRIVSYQLNK